jgi:hypothetical protein
MVMGGTAAQLDFVSFGFDEDTPLAIAPAEAPLAANVAAADSLIGGSTTHEGASAAAPDYANAAACAAGGDSAAKPMLSSAMASLRVESLRAHCSDETVEEQLHCILELGHGTLEVVDAELTALLLDAEQLMQERLARAKRRGSTLRGGTAGERTPRQKRYSSSASAAGDAPSVAPPTPVPVVENLTGAHAANARSLAADYAPPTEALLHNAPAGAPLASLPSMQRLSADAGPLSASCAPSAGAPPFVSANSAQSWLSLDDTVRRADAGSAGDCVAAFTTADEGGDWVEGDDGALGGLERAPLQDEEDVPFFSLCNPRGMDPGGMGQQSPGEQEAGSLSTDAADAPSVATSLQALAGPSLQVLCAGDKDPGARATPLGLPGAAGIGLRRAGLGVRMPSGVSVPSCSSVSAVSSSSRSECDSPLPPSDGADASAPRLRAKRNYVRWTSTSSLAKAVALPVTTPRRASAESGALVSVGASEGGGKDDAAAPPCGASPLSEPAQSSRTSALPSFATTARSSIGAKHRRRSANDAELWSSGGISLLTDERRHSHAESHASQSGVAGSRSSRLMGMMGSLLTKGELSITADDTDAREQLDLDVGATSRASVSRQRSCNAGLNLVAAALAVSPGSSPAQSPCAQRRGSRSRLSTEGL